MHPPLGYGHFRVDHARDEFNQRARARESVFEEEFEGWYQHYPRKVSRGPAEKALRKALGSGVSLETMIEGDKRYTTQVAGSESDYIKQPATWLNGKCWRDEPEPRRGAEPDGELTWWQKRWLEEQVAAELNGT